MISEIIYNWTTAIGPDYIFFTFAFFVVIVVWLILIDNFK